MIINDPFDPKAQIHLQRAASAGGAAGREDVARHYPNVPELSIERCGSGLELRIESPAINVQGWLRAIFYVHVRTRTICVVDLFWKKTNKVTTADLHRVEHRIRLLKAQLK